MIAASLGHSAEIKMSLRIGDRELAVREVGPGDLVLSQPTVLRAPSAELLISIDGETRCCPIEILDVGGESRDIVRYRPLR
ncbi:MAG: hypothetical protein DCC68_23055 [Planctomycetota bacterium]|nr:MAG: hypothetical protein DCC68_23055 [Planctomycetota bacterium]